MRWFLLSITFLFIGCTKPASTESASVSAVPITEWTHKELLAHLEQKGKKYVAFRAKSLSMYFAKEGSGSAIGEEWAIGRFIKGEEDVLLVSLVGKEQVAREQAGTMGDQGFSHGRFLFQGQPRHLNEIRAVFGLPVTAESSSKTEKVDKKDEPVKKKKKDDPISNQKKSARSSPKVRRVEQPGHSTTIAIASSRVCLQKPQQSLLPQAAPIIEMTTRCIPIAPNRAGLQGGIAMVFL